MAKKSNKSVKVENKKDFSALRSGIMSMSNFSGGIFIDQNQLLELYRQNPDIRQAVQKIANYVGKKGCTLYNKETDEALDNEKSKDIKLTYLDYIKSPTLNQFKRRFFRDMLICGEVFLTYTVNPQRKFNGIQIIDPRTVTKHFSESGVVVGYTQVSNKKTQTYTNNPLNTEHPYMKSYMYEEHVKNENMGMGLLESVVWDALSDLEASKRNYYVMENDMTPPSMFLLDADISTEEQNILINQLRERHKGSENQGKPLVGSGVKDIKQLTLSPKDMEYINQKKLTTVKVASAFGVPKFVLGYTDDVNLANGQGQKQEFIEGTIVPMQELFSFVLNDFLDDIALRPELGLKELEYFIDFNTDAIDTDIDRDKLALEKLKSGAITIDEFREDDGRKAYEGVENSNKPMVQNSMILLEDLAFDIGVNPNEV